MVRFSNVTFIYNEYKHGLLYWADDKPLCDQESTTRCIDTVIAINM